MLCTFLQNLLCVPFLPIRLNVCNSEGQPLSLFSGLSLNYSTLSFLFSRLSFFCPIRSGLSTLPCLSIIYSPRLSKANVACGTPCVSFPKQPLFFLRPIFFLKYYYERNMVAQPEEPWHMHPIPSFDSCSPSTITRPPPLRGKLTLIDTRPVCKG